ncbi:hypothetical protein ACFSRY_12990 [Pontibacter locisalis]|uniref:Uncharacterized protein n=1 Tax=Pontibacter locisalis TaxID=1719035 RepID=A0ABW5IMA0_9BACT
MKRIKNIVVITLLLIGGLWLCVSVSFEKKLNQYHTLAKTSEGSKEHLSQEKHSKSTAWFEQIAPCGASVNLAEKLPAFLMLPFHFLPVHNWQHISLKASKVTLYFTSLSEQFRILPNAP